MSTANRFSRSTRDVQCSALVKTHPSSKRFASLGSQYIERNTCQKHWWFNPLSVFLTGYIPRSTCGLSSWHLLMWSQIQSIVILNSSALCYWWQIWNYTSFFTDVLLFILSCSFQKAYTFHLISYLCFKTVLGLFPMLISWENYDIIFFSWIYVKRVISLQIWALCVLFINKTLYYQQ